MSEILFEEHITEAREEEARVMDWYPMEVEEGVAVTLGVVAVRELPEIEQSFTDSSIEEMFIAVPESVPEKLREPYGKWVYKSLTWLTENDAQDGNRYLQAEEQVLAGVETEVLAEEYIAWKRTAYRSQDEYAEALRGENHEVIYTARNSYRTNLNTAWGGLIEMGEEQPRSVLEIRDE